MTLTILGLSRMPPLYLVKFRQLILGTLAHWGIFVPCESSPEPTDGFPAVGYLYHASKAWERCHELHLCNTGATYYEACPFDLRKSKTLLSFFRLHDTDVEHADVYNACTQVSQNRTFHYISQNCQDWVKDVIAHLVDEEKLSESVFEEMELQGYRTLKDSECVRCCQKSSFCWCKLKRRK
jgi:hypothetical protein